MNERLAADWVAIDWGTTNLRAWAMSAEGAVLAETASGAGMGTLQSSAYESALLELITAWLPDTGRLPVLVCGMAGARQGWCEAPYLTTPCPPLRAERVARPTLIDRRLDVTILHGVAQREPADVMRGEETQIAGWLNATPGFEGTLCLPGTHTKWVRVSNGCIDRFTTCMSGELYASISTGTVLRHSLDERWDESSFVDQIDRLLARPQDLAAALFSIRARSLLGAPAAGSARAALSGILIGSELAAVRSDWTGRQTVIIGSGTLCDRYASALARAGVDAARASAERLVIDGLRAAYVSLQRLPT